MLAQQPAPVEVTGTKHYTPVQRHAVGEWVIWTGAMIFGVMLVIGLALVVLDRHRRQVLRDAGKKKMTKPQPDPWTESGKRIDPDTAGSRDDTVDIDPDELGPTDIDDPPDPPDPDEPPDPHGEGGGRGRNIHQ